MPETPPRRSPIHDLLEARGAEFRVVGGVALAVRFPTAENHADVPKSVGLCDQSGLPKLGLKGRDAESWLANQRVDVPAAIYDSRPLPDGGVIVRFGTDEFFLEGGVGGEFVPALAAELESRSGHLYDIHREEAAFVLLGSRVGEVLSQTCALDFRALPPRRVVFTRVAGVSCGIFPDSADNVPSYRIWVDYASAPYLWETLVEIVESLGGSVVPSPRGRV
ncbi:MAG: hypothetical protein WD066_14430 [Planctomycetaceae bacterium]